jgi:hypothetical protein
MLVALGGFGGNFGEFLDFREKSSELVIELVLELDDRMLELGRFFHPARIDQFQGLHRGGFIALVLALDRLERRDHVDEFFFFGLRMGVIGGLFGMRFQLPQFLFDLAAKFFEFMDSFLEILADLRVSGHFLAEAEGAFEIHRLFELVNGNLGQPAGQGNVLFGDRFQFAAYLVHLPYGDGARYGQQRQTKPDDAINFHADGHRQGRFGSPPGLAVAIRPQVVFSIGVGSSCLEGRIVCGHWLDFPLSGKRIDIGCEEPLARYQETFIDGLRRATTH